MKKFSAESLFEVLRLVGDGLRERHLAAGERKFEKKADGTPLTEADRWAHDQLLRGLPSIYDVAVLSEESESVPDQLPNEPIWVVDPIDGTKEFVKGLPEFAVSVGLWDGSGLVAGGVLNPATGEAGCVGTSGPAVFTGAVPGNLISTSRTESRRYDALYPPQLRNQLRPVGSIAYKLLRVAAGSDRACFSLEPKSSWDIFGGLALLSAVGLPIDSLSGEPLLGNRNVRLSGGMLVGKATEEERRMIFACWRASWAP